MQQTMSLRDALKLAADRLQAGQLAMARSIFEQVLQADPMNVDALHLLGVTALRSGDAGRAAALITRAVDLDPRQAAFLVNLGQAKIATDDRAGAAACFARALAADPGLVPAHGGLARLLLDRGEPEAAAGHLRDAVRLAPEDADLHNRLGTALKRSRRFDQAAACFRRAVELAPGHAAAHYNLGNCLKALDHPEAAEASHRRSYELDPKYAAASLLNRALKTCSWARLDGLKGRLDELLDASAVSGAWLFEDPLTNVTRCDDPARNLAVARLWSADLARKAAFDGGTFDHRPRAKAAGKITLGYLSGDFRNHAISHLTRGLYGLHDRADFEVLALSYGPDDGSPYRAGITRDCDRFIDLAGLTDRAAAQRILDERVDILIDLTGHTTEARLGICARRPAPVQVTYLGFPGTSGADFFDYLVADRIVIPEGHAAHYSERIVTLPHAYQVNDNRQEVAAWDVRRRDQGLPDDGFVFCSFNRCVKLDPIMFGAWMAILARVPRSVLWLWRDAATTEENLRREAEARGIDGARLVFADKQPKDRHLARFALADLALDTRLYNGHTTTSDALWAGVPVVTLLGRHFASRVSASLLTAVGLGELVSESLEAYVDLAARLALDRDELAAVKKRLGRGRLRAPLFDTARFVANLEAAYRVMWLRHARGEAPRPIALSDLQAAESS